MPTYRAPVDDYLFVLNDVLNVERYGNLEGFADASSDVIKAVLEESARIAEEVLQPINRDGDEFGCTRHEDGSVTTPPGFKEAYETYKESGWLGLACNPEYGGQGLPYVLATAVSEIVTAANMSFGMYPGLTQGAIAALEKHGSKEQKDLYLPKMVAGDWTGTMNLTEPHCGTDLGLIKTKAVPQGDGSYKISGQKIFISAGEHDLSDNIIHLVLARIEGGPAGVKGISLFVVPKFIPDDQGEVGERNGVSCGSIEEKMGLHGNSTCVMNYDEATGWLIGEEHKGLKAMFVMMNEARLAVGVQGLGLSEVSYQNAVDYARDRLQGRALSGVKAEEKPADPIIVHPDVRRVLMNSRALNEAARALVLWTALHSDIKERSEDEKEVQASEDVLGLMTPVIKGFITDKGFDNTVAAQQMYGGHGYVREWGMEQFVRDARIAMIYEGANGIQALDLVGRKLPANGGRSVMAFFNEVGTFVAENAENEELKPYIEPLKTSAEHLQAATMWFMQNAMKKPDNAGAGSTDYMHLFGLVACAYMWAKMAKASKEKLAESANGSAEFYENKLTTGRYFMERMLPETGAHLARIQSGADSMMALPAEAF